jgi:hypothetical protein
MTVGVPGSESDFLDDGDDDGDGFIDTTAEPVPAKPVTAASSSSSVPAARKRMVRVKPLSGAMAQNPDIVTVIVTKRDGSQVIFVRQQK